MIEHGTEETGSVDATPSWFRMKAVFVHLYTASGAVLALLMLVAAFQGEAVQALWLMFFSLLIDSTDGLLARRFRVSEALPFFDGALLASSYQFCRVDAKTDDHFFLGFPSYFNVVAFYAIVFGPGPGTLATILVVCSFLVFVPIRYVYPTRTVVFRKLSLTLTTLWLASYAAILWQMPDPHPLLLAFSLLYLFYYFGLSLYLSAKMLEARRLEEQPEA